MEVVGSQFREYKQETSTMQLLAMDLYLVIIF